MRVVLAYTAVHPLTQASLERYAPGHEAFYVGHNAKAYCALLCDLWAAGDGFLLVEHDIELHDRVLPELQACPEPWCTFPYPGAGWAQTGDPLLYDSLGCTRFSSALLAAEPDVMAEAARASGGLEPGDWRHMDVSLNPRLRWRGYEPHVHWPAVAHHHAYIDGCACGSTH
ncbi:MAG: hypothetical protein ACYDA6_00155 [Solirubrobacteraceae bacterium]